MSQQIDSQLIFAQSSAKGRSAIAIHRISGINCQQILAPFLKKPSSMQNEEMEKDELLQLRHGRSRYCLLYDTKGVALDDCVVTFYKSPKSYTGDDTLEIAAHGNPLISAQIHSLFRELGMRDARPGEFTQRAFLNGKIDLSRAEAIDQLIHADTAGGIQLARAANSGKISQHTDGLRKKIISSMAYFEAHIDFAEDEIGSYDAAKQTADLKEVHHALTDLASSFEYGIKIREGLKLVFAGEPNAGKSSLYNALLGSQRAIVTDIPGTTRDVVEDRLTIAGRDFVLLDTAGLRETNDVVEKLGIEKTITAVLDADVVCCIVDPQRCEQDDLLIYVKSNIQKLCLSSTETSKAKLLIVFSKSDQWNDKIADRVKETSMKLEEENISGVSCSSALADIEELKRHLLLRYDTETNRNSGVESPILISLRQRDKAKLAAKTLEEAMLLTERGDFPEKIASLLVLTCQHLSEVIGEVGTEDILENIFANFCIGK
jgi:tRNA modification GTPase